MDRLENFKVLVLDSQYKPITVISWQRAMYLLISHKIEVLTFYNEKVRSTNLEFDLPAVIKVNWVSKYSEEVNFSRWAVFARDNYVCGYCQKKTQYKFLTLDHIIPESKGGPKNWLNIVSACVECNYKKANRTPEEACMPLKIKPFAPKWNPKFLLNFNRLVTAKEWEFWI